MGEQRQSQPYEERFQFKLYANDNIVCQRYFKINKLNENSLLSMGLKDIIDVCVAMIDEDLKSKTRVYLSHVAPIILETREQLYSYINTNRTNGWAAKSNTYQYADNLAIGTMFYITSEEVELIWDGTDFQPYKGYTNIDTNEFVRKTDETYPIVFKFVFLDNEHEVISKIWDGNCYPKFVRNGVDLSNKKGKFEGGETALTNAMTSGKTDLVYAMIRLICDYCSSNEITYINKPKYGKTVYINDPEKRLEAWAKAK